jgi:hypothetical protein
MDKSSLKAREPQQNSPIVKAWLPFLEESQETVVHEQDVRIILLRSKCSCILTFTLQEISGSLGFEILETSL